MKDKNKQNLKQFLVIVCVCVSEWVSVILFFNFVVVIVVIAGVVYQSNKLHQFTQPYILNYKQNLSIKSTWATINFNTRRIIIFVLVVFWYSCLIWLTSKPSHSTNKINNLLSIYLFFLFLWHVFFSRANNTKIFFSKYQNNKSTA